MLSLARYNEPYNPILRIEGTSDTIDIAEVVGVSKWTNGSEWWLKLRLKSPDISIEIYKDCSETVVLKSLKQVREKMEEYKAYLQNR